MNLSQFKLIVTDLDGTLVKSGSDEISPAVKAAVFYLRNMGIHFAIATGRDWKHTRKIARELEVTVPVILQAGAVIMDPLKEKVLRLQPLRPEIETQLWEYINLHAGEWLETDHLCLNETGQYFTAKINTFSGNWLLDATDYCVTQDPYLAAAPVMKHLFIGPEQHLKQVVADLNREIVPPPNSILWPSDPQTKDWFLEVFDPRASKGQAVEWLADFLKVKRHQVLAFGDGMNDIDLLQWSGEGVAVEGAPPEVMAAADSFIPGPDSDGVARFIMNKLEGPCSNCG